MVLLFHKLTLDSRLWKVMIQEKPFCVILNRINTNLSVAVSSPVFSEKSNGKMRNFCRFQKKFRLLRAADTLNPMTAPNHCVITFYVYERSHSNKHLNNSSIGHSLWNAKESWREEFQNKNQKEETTICLADCLCLLKTRLACLLAALIPLKTYFCQTSSCNKCIVY